MKLFRHLNPRIWSNIELKKFAHLFIGEIINVSGWSDEDKEAERYRNYFLNAKNYYLSNYSKDKIRGPTKLVKTDFFIDLEKNLPPHLIDRFDTVFNHTTLEHISNPVFAFKNLSLMTKDILITIAPFKQKLHFQPGCYGDYFRFSPMAMRMLYKKNGFEILYENCSYPLNIDIYLFYIGTKKYEVWEDKIKQRLLHLEKFNQKLGMNDWRTLTANLIYNILQRIRFNFFSL